jgi:hypothetical protein
MQIELILSFILTQEGVLAVGMSIRYLAGETDKELNDICNIATSSVYEYALKDLLELCWHQMS